MTTVGNVIDRLYALYLEPPDAQPAVALLGPAITDVASSFSIDRFMITEDETLMSQGVVVQIDSELILVGAYDATLKEASLLTRGYQGTVAAAHDASVVVTLSPSFPRLSAFEAVADNIITLHPALFTANIVETSTVDGMVAPMEDPLAVSIIEIFAEGARTDPVSGRIIDYHPAVGGRAIIIDRYAGPIWVRYRRRMGKATSEADTLVDLGVDERWANIVIVGAAADLLAGRDIPAAQTDWISAGIEAETIRVGTRASVSTALARYRELLMSRATAEMRNEYRPQVRMRRVFGG